MPSALLIGAIHLGTNMIPLVSLGKSVETQLRPSRTILLYLLAVLSGGLAQILFSQTTTPMPLVGASAGVFGIVLAYCAMYPRRILLFFFIKCKAGKLGYFLLISTSLILLASYLQPHFTDRDQLNPYLSIILFNIGHAAHLGGAIIGAIIGILARPIPQPQRPHPALLPADNTLLHATAESLPAPQENLIEAVSRSHPLSPAQRHQILTELQHQLTPQQPHKPNPKPNKPSP